MFEKLIPYIQLGIEFLKQAIDCVMQLVRILAAAEESIAKQKATQAAAG